MSHEVHLEGLGFPEGPVALADGSIVFVDLLHQNVRRYFGGRTSVVATLQGSPNGMRQGPDGRLYIANNGGVAPASLHEVRIMQPQLTGRIQRLALDGHCEDVITELPGKGPWRPNDLVFASDGRIIFIDPQNWAAPDGVIATASMSESLCDATGPRLPALPTPWLLAGA
jgi:sugar lactone lactonase YvrE